jgi:hypothetical protein
MCEVMICGSGNVTVAVCCATASVSSDFINGRIYPDHVSDRYALKKWSHSYSQVISTAYGYILVLLSRNPLQNPRFAT